MTRLPEWLRLFLLSAGSLVLVQGVLTILLTRLSPEYADWQATRGARPWLTVLLTGGVLGGLVTLAARLGRNPPRPAASLVRLLAFALTLVAMLAAAATIAGAVLVAQKAVALPEELADAMPVRRHGSFVAAMLGLAAVKTVWPVVGLTCGVVWLSRRRPGRLLMSGTDHSRGASR